MSSMKDFSLELWVRGILITTNIFVSESLAHYIVLGKDVMNMLNLALNEKWIQIVLKCNNPHVGSIQIMKHSQQKIKFCCKFSYCEEIISNE